MIMLYCCTTLSCACNIIFQVHTCEKENWTDKFFMPSLTLFCFTLLTKVIKFRGPVSGNIFQDAVRGMRMRKDNKEQKCVTESCYVLMWTMYVLVSIYIFYNILFYYYFKVIALKVYSNMCCSLRDYLT